MTQPVLIDGSAGEGGGQIVRSSLTLSLLTQKPVVLKNIRKKRGRPGLMRQHLTCVQAAQQISGAEVEGAHIGSQELRFAPGPLQPGDYTFSVGSAGSTSLVLQTILPALAVAEAPSRVDLRGGTHNPLAPPFDFLQRAFFPLIERMGPRIEATLVRPGFYPAGGGQAIYEITPCATLTPLELRTRGEIVETRARARVAQLSPKIGEREINTLCDELGWDRAVAKVERVKKSSGPGNVLLVEVKSDALCEVFVGFGEKGVPAEQVARDVAAEVKQYLAADVPVGQHLADQLLLWIALCGQGSFVTLPPMQHTMTQRDVIKAFIDVDIRCQQLADGRFQLNVSPEEN